MLDLDNWIPKQARVFRKKRKNSHGKKRFPNYETYCRFKMNEKYEKIINRFNIVINS